jgi:hypothetical protein
MGGVCDWRSDQPGIELSGYWTGTEYGGECDTWAGYTIDQFVGALAQLQEFDGRHLDSVCGIWMYVCVYRIDRGASWLILMLAEVGVEPG